MDYISFQGYSSNKYFKLSKVFYFDIFVLKLILIRFSSISSLPCLIQHFYNSFKFEIPYLSNRGKKLRKKSEKKNSGKNSEKNSEKISENISEKNLEKMSENKCSDQKMDWMKIIRNPIYGWSDVCRSSYCARSIVVLKIVTREIATQLPVNIMTVCHLVEYDFGGPSKCLWRTV